MQQTNTNNTYYARYFVVSGGSAQLQTNRMRARANVFRFEGRGATFRVWYDVQ